MPVLCRLLQTALGGAGETAIIICCSPAIKSAQETLSTLRFGARAQGIVKYCAGHSRVRSLAS
jgi:kinesin family member 5